MTPRERALVRLKQLLPPERVRKLLPDGLEKMVASCENTTRLYKGNKLEDEFLYELLFDQHNFELLRDRDLRDSLLQKVEDDVLARLMQYNPNDRARGSRRGTIDTIVSRNWHPGKGWARCFVHNLGLPEELAGSADEGGMPTIEELEPYVDLPPLHDFQAELVAKMRPHLQQRARGPRAILSLPTGAGKTRTMMEALIWLLVSEANPPSLILWLAQSEELCEQAVQSVREVWTSQTVRAATSTPPRHIPHTLSVHRLWAGHDLKPMGEPAFLVAGIQKLTSMAKKQNAALQALLERVEVLVIDEAHHAIAPSYTDLFRQLGLERGKGKRAVFGLTATPYRGSEEETRRLVGRFQSRLIIPPWDNAVNELRKREILAHSEVEACLTNFSISLEENELKHYEKFHDLSDSVLRRIGQNRDRNRLTLERLKKIPPGQATLFFACSVSQASTLAVLLRRAGRTAVAVTGATPYSTRRHWIQQFKDGEVQFLCNFGVLTTGFDAPRVECVVMGRPTTSVLLYEQMVGRGMRGPRNGGTEKCKVIDLVDSFPRYGGLMSYERYRNYWPEFSKIQFSLEGPG